MNLTNLENLARTALKGGNVKEQSNSMVKTGLLTPAEHRSIESLSRQIVANVRASKMGGSTVALEVGPMAWWR